MPGSWAVEKVVRDSSAVAASPAASRRAHWAVRQLAPCPGKPLPHGLECPPWGEAQPLAGIIAPGRACSALPGSRNRIVMSSIFRAGGLPRYVAATALFFVALLCAPHADALELPRARSVPGGVALVDLGPALVAPQASVDGVPVLVSGRPGGWTAVVGIALDVEPGERVLEVRREGAPPESVRFAVTPVRYAEQRLKVAPGKVDLSE